MEVGLLGVHFGKHTQLSFRSKSFFAAVCCMVLMFVLSLVKEEDLGWFVFLGTYYFCVSVLVFFRWKALWEWLEGFEDKLIGHNEGEA